ncbi:beta-L-arabinofuranosidase domain-containing protein [Rubripirellula lacrimiformis]|nr:beta-L-arabinofuranosidase domain-containing protein [Rubripirellula lacrimiformis]
MKRIIPGPLARRIVSSAALTCLLISIALTARADDGALTGVRHRVLVSSDIGGTDPDDVQSMVHLLVYADCIDIEGLVSSPYGPGRKRDILNVIDAYAKDFPQLHSHDGTYPTPDTLRGICKQGAIDTPDASGVGQPTEGSQWIVQRARADDPRPLHVLVWGGIEDLAQALHDAPDILPKLRVYFIGGPNKKWCVDAYNYVEQNHPKLWIIEANATYRGWFVGGKQQGEWRNKGFVAKHIAGHGHLGKVFVDAKADIKMGDTPSVARLLNGVSDDPTKPGWGGKYVPIWDGRKTIFDRLTTASDTVEVFGVTEFRLPRPDGFTSNHTAQMVFNRGRPTAAAAIEGDTLRFRFAPRDAKVWSYVVESDCKELDGKSGKVTAIAPPPSRTRSVSKVHPHWWIDDPDPAMAESVHPGAKTVNRWRQDFLRDFADRMDRCMAAVVPDATVQTNKPRPNSVVARVPLSGVHWTDGFWQQRYSTCRDKLVPAMWEIMKGTKYKPYLEHFRIAAGLAEGQYHGAQFNDGDFYKWIEAACAIQAVDPDPARDKQLDEIIAVIGKAQRADGYLHTPVLVAARNGDFNAIPFGDRFNFEMYNMGHLMTTACLHHEVTGKDDLLAIARKAADFLDEAFRNPTPENARHAICPSHYMGIIDLYRTTKEPRYLELAKRLIQMRDLVVDGGDDNQDRIPFTDQNEAVGHAVRATYLYAGIADLYAETGDANLWSALTPIWQNVVEKKMYLTGGCGALFDGASPDGSRNQKSITRIHQAFGRNYQLPNITAHNETCANIGNCLWNWRMFLASGESKYIDVLEQTLYNSVLSGVSLDGTEFFYTNPLRHYDGGPVDLRWSRSRVPFMTAFCCPPNVARTIAATNGYAYGQSTNTVWVNLYGSNTLDTTLEDGSRVRLKQESNYPWDGKVRLTVMQCDSDSAGLKLRIPGWANSATIHVDGVPTGKAAVPGSYATIDQSLRQGMSIDLRIPMPVMLIETHPMVEETRNHVAVKRGPMVYCLESSDLPHGTSMADIRVPADVVLRPRFDADLLQGVTVLEGNLSSRPEGDWKGTLYRQYSPKPVTTVPATFVPYYAWANRQRGEMTVWLPLN